MRIERGDRLLQFHQEEDMKITKTWFQFHPSRIYTWKSAVDSSQNVIQNQIDFLTSIENSAQPLIEYDQILLEVVKEIPSSSKRNTTLERRLEVEKITDSKMKPEMSNEIYSQIEPITNAMQ